MSHAPRYTAVTLLLGAVAILLIVAGVPAYGFFAVVVAALCGMRACR